MCYLVIDQSNWKLDKFGRPDITKDKDNVEFYLTFSSGQAEHTRELYNVLTLSTGRLDKASTLSDSDGDMRAPGALASWKMSHAFWRQGSSNLKKATTNANW